ITERGVRNASGEIELDMLILATGYDALTGALIALDVKGKNGQTVNQKWKQGGRSTLGIMMEGFPNLFMTTGPNGPSALANIIRISEHDVDWIAAAITHMQRNGLATMVPTPQAEDNWMEVVRGLAQRSLINKAKTWWVGANVPGKSQGLSMFIGGFAKYREFSAAAAGDGYSGFAFERAEEKAEA
ncbi:MAG: cyclohexanone monooxygenase, partial [Polaromonas sp.]|nr:cyclohexanone monooxygenase [Polaromonas sp.]